MTDASDGAILTNLPAPHAHLRLGASMLTPFDHRGHLNEQAYCAQVRRLVDAGLDLWVASSGTAEGNVLTTAELDRVTELAVAEAASRTKVYAMGVEPRSAHQAIEFSNRMHSLGVDAVQIGPLEPGHSYVPNEAELRGFYDSVLAETTSPSILTSHVSAGYEIPPETLSSIADDHAERVVGLTATHLQNHNYVAQLLEAVGDHFPVWTGSPVRALDNCALGVKGFTSSMDVNIAPQLYAAFMTAWADRDLTALLAAYRAMIRLFQRVLAAGGLIIVKAILVRLGLDVGTTRAPRRAAGDAEYRVADQIIAEFALPRI